jgi:hypothetical protein
VIELENKSNLLLLLKERNYAMDGGPLNPKEKFSEKKILSTLEAVGAINPGGKVITSDAVATV